MIYFIIYLFLEVMLSTALSTQIGGLNTFLEILVSATIGILLLKNFKLSLSESINKAKNGQITQEEFIKTNAAKAIGAILLIVPGIFTDILGILMQLPFFVAALSKVYTFKNPRNHANYSTNFSSTDFGFNRTNFTNTHKKTNNTNYKRNTDEIIDVEIIDDNNSLKH